MKVIGNMKDLKQHIEESLLDDFDTISNNQDKTFDRPFVSLYKNCENLGWENTVEDFEAVIASRGKKVTSIPRLSKDDVYAAIYEEDWQPNHPVLYIKYSTTAFKSFKDARQKQQVGYRMRGMHSMPAWKGSAITIRYSMRNKAPYISAAETIMDKVDTSKFKYGYLLSKEHAADAIKMLDLMGQSKWNENNW